MMVVNPEDGYYTDCTGERHDLPQDAQVQNALPDELCGRVGVHADEGKPTSDETQVERQKVAHEDEQDRKSVV
jgi:hypothetical protein